MKKSKETIILIVVIGSLCLSICTIAFSVSLNAKISKLEDVFAQATGVDVSQTATTISDKDKNLSYDTVMFGEAEVSFPKSGTVGKKNSKDNRYIEIESISITVRESDISNGYLHFDFIGTDYYSDNPKISVKQFDADGFCISEGHASLVIVKGERSKGLGVISNIKSTAKRIVIDVEP